MLTIKLQDHKFIAMSSKFCEKIDAYAPILEMDETVVKRYKLNCSILDQIVMNIENYNDSLQNFASQKIEDAKAAFRALVQLCKRSSHYTKAIGIDLGIEEVNWALPFYPN